MSYLLDSDVFIQAKNPHYGLDFCPAFWEWLIATNTARLVFSTEKVGDGKKKGSSLGLTVLSVQLEAWGTFASRQGML